MATDQKKTWDDHARDAEAADYDAHGHSWNFDPAAGAPRLRAFSNKAQLFAYPDAWAVRFSHGAACSDVQGEATSYGDAQRRAHEAYTALRPLAFTHEGEG